MFIYGRTSSNAVAIMSYLAAKGKQRSGSSEIAEARSISRALTAKLLTQLASAGFVSGQPGPGGGYTLAVDASEITLFQIVDLFEQTETPSACPFGPHWCGNGAPCPLHDSIVEIAERNRRFLESTTLSVFVGADPGGALPLESPASAGQSASDPASPP